MPENNWAGIPYDDLSEEQKGFLTTMLDNTDRNYFLHGCAGSGKTVLAAHGTKILTQEDKTVIFVVYTKLLAKFVADGFQGVGASIHEVDHYHKWAKDLTFYGEYDMAVIDECQDFETKWIENVKANSTNQIWLGDPNQQIYGDAMQDGGFRTIFSEFGDKEFELKVNYRNSISTAQLAVAFLNNNEFDNAISFFNQAQKISPTVPAPKVAIRQSKNQKTQHKISQIMRNASLLEKELQWHSAA
ncbi:MAG: AAA family ATPase, partial [Dehalococcoidia bacterium]|nr:AAA family ATPase [Dehalococcoidia bacterium]